MNKGIELTQSQIKAYESGATMFLFPIDKDKISISFKENNYKFFNSAYKFECDYCKGKDGNCTDCYGRGFIWDIDCESIQEFINKYAPVQKGDKDIFIKEEFGIKPYHTLENPAYIYKSSNHSENFIKLFEWKLAIEMPKKLSRYSFIECINIKVVRVGNLLMKEMFECGLYKALTTGKFPYEDTDYVFLAEFIRKDLDEE